MFTRRQSRAIIENVDSLSDAPSGDMAHGWVYGVFLALCVAALGIRFIWIRQAWFFGSLGRGITLLRLQGPAAVWLGCFLISLALVLHFHWLWGNHPRLGRYHDPAKHFALAALLVTAIGFTINYIQFLQIFR